MDLWGQFWFLDKGERLGKTMRRYQEVYFTPIRVGANAFAVKYEPRGFAEKAILEKTQDIALKLNAEDWFDIQKPIVMDVEVTLDEKVMKAYRSLERNLYVELGEYAVDTANAATKTSACLQLASGNLYEGEEVTPDFERLAEAKAAQSVERVDGGTTKPYFHVHDSKLRALASIVEEANGMPILVAYQFKHERDRILSYFKGSRVLDKNPQTIRDWNAGKIPMLLAHPASCGPRPQHAGRREHPRLLLHRVEPRGARANHRAHRTDTTGAGGASAPRLRLQHHRKRHSGRSRPGKNYHQAQCP